MPSPNQPESADSPNSLFLTTRWSGVLALIALLLGAGIAIPVAMLRAADEKSIPYGSASAVNPAPKDTPSNALFDQWISSARSNGMIPGGRIGEMAASLKTYMDLNAGTEAATRCEGVLKKCDASHDWTPADAVALLDEIETAAPSRAQWAMRTNVERTIHPGTPLPDELKNAPWGPPVDFLDPSSVAIRGLRMAWLLAPGAEGPPVRPDLAPPLDSILKSRILFHNTSRATVCFATEDWIQSGTHSAKDAHGRTIPIWSTERMGVRTRMIFRLDPGEYAEVEGHGIGIGSHETASEKSIYKVGAWIEATEGDAVTFRPGTLLVSFQTWQNDEGRKDSETVWNELIAARVAQEGPWPATVADRELLLKRITRDLGIALPPDSAGAALTHDNSPDGLAKLTTRLQAAGKSMPFAGELTGGDTTFRVIAADPNAAHAPNPPQPPPPPPQKPMKSATLQPATEQILEWSEPVNGLRLALAWPPSLGEAAAGEAADLFAVVQNVSKAPTRLLATAESPDERWLDIRDDAGTLSRLSSKEPSGVDVTLQPGEAAFLRLLPEGAKDPARVTTGAVVASDVRQSPKLKLRAGLRIATAPAGAWSGTLTTPDTRAGLSVETPANRKAQELLKVWIHSARLSGKVPGGFIARLGEHVKVFVKANAADASGAPFAKRMEPLLRRLDGQRDWPPGDASALLNEIAAVSDGVLTVALEEIAAGKVQHGLPWMKDLANAPWSKPLSNGLRTAAIVGPGVASRLHYVDWIGNVVTQNYAASNKVEAAPAEGPVPAIPLGTALGCRLLIHNAGREPVVFRTRTWHHIEPTATDATGAEIGMESVTRLTRAPLMTFRLDPDRYIELPTPGFGLGKYGFHDFKQADIATWIGAKAGDEVTLTPGPLPLSDWNEATAVDGEPRWWLDFISARLDVMSPLPADPADRDHLLRSAIRDLFLQNVTPTPAETAAFLSDTSPQALTTLAERLFHRPGLHAWAGPLQSGVTKFRVTAAAGGTATPTDNPASPPPPATLAPADRSKAAPDGTGERGPAETKLKVPPADATVVAPEGRKGVVDPALIPPDPEALRKPGGNKGAMLQKETEQALSWGPATHGLRAAVVLLDAPTFSDGSVLEQNIVIQNVSDSVVRLRGHFPTYIGSPFTGPSSIGSAVIANKDGHTLKSATTPLGLLSGAGDFDLQPRAVAVLPTTSIGFTGGPPAKSTRGRVVALNCEVKPGNWTLQCSLSFNDEGFWKGTLKCGPIPITIEPKATQSKSDEARKSEADK